MTDDMDRITIEMGMLDILLETCVKFVPRSHETNFLDIQPRFGSVLYLGLLLNGHRLRITFRNILLLVSVASCKICSDNLVPSLFVLP